MPEQDDISQRQSEKPVMSAEASAATDEASANKGSAEHRSYVRRETKLPGKITYGEYSFALDCTIRDLSVTGALVAVSHPKKLPNKLVLIEPSNFLAFEASVAWRGINLIGLSFDRVIFLDQDLDDRNRILVMHAKMARTQWGSHNAAAC